MTDSLWLSVRVVCGPQWYCLGRKLCSRGNSQKLNIEITRQVSSEREWKQWNNTITTMKTSWTWF